MALALAVIGLALGAHGLYRRRKYWRKREVHQTWPEQRDIRLELSIAGSLFILGLLTPLLSLFLYNKSMENLTHNIEQYYEAQDVELRDWNGSWARADLTLADGTRFEDVQVRYDDVEYTPLIWEVLEHRGETATGPDFPTIQLP
ncbi:hypothetical protein [Micrococcoides hystricis]|uniref:DUF3592 domain-containing protein n=1 Tax=Micrococcoides hystricis TaxID=1572761 RepID=A0ABV6PA76_9MICC